MQSFQRFTEIYLKRFDQSVRTGYIKIKKLSYEVKEKLNYI